MTCGCVEVLGFLSQYDGSADGDAEEVLPLIDALRRAIAIVQGRPQMVQMAEEERKQLTSQAQATLHEWRRRSQARHITSQGLVKCRSWSRCRPRTRRRWVEGWWQLAGAEVGAAARPSGGG